ncbi:unnamed protein product [Tuber aestivum]|uniref:Uncharacterized protein n=1 Tax=Tuber aestivum TaxID=59557 RepID=A0A292PKD0_9PEZI|nr:unnamed protein product [Tuber aestivum]
MSRAKQRGSQRGPRPRVGRPRGRGRKSIDQGSTANGSITPTPPPQEGESMEAGEAEPEHTVPTPAPRTSARQPTMPLQATLRRRKGAQDSCTGSKTSKESPVHMEAPNNPIAEVPENKERPDDGGEGVSGADNHELHHGDEGNGGDRGGCREGEDERRDEAGEGEGEDEQEEVEGPNIDERPPKRRRTKLEMIQDGLAGHSTSTDKSPPSGAKAGRARSRVRAPVAKGKGGTEAVRGRGRPGRGKGSRQTGGPGSRGGKGAYRPRKPKVVPANGENAVKTAPAAAPAKEPGTSCVASDVTKYDWTSELRKDVSIVRPTKNLALARLSVTVTKNLASLEQLKERQCALRETAKTYSRTMINLNRERASQVLKDLKGDKDYFSKTPFYQQVQERLEKKVEGRISVLERDLDFKKGNASEVFNAEQWAVREAFETNFVELCEHTIQRFLREGHELSELWAVEDPYLNEHVLRRCNLDHIDQVTMTDLVENFITRGGRDRSVFDRPQIATRSNQGLYDRKVLETSAERCKRAGGAVSSGLGTPAVSPPPMRPQEPAQRENSISNEKSAAGENSSSGANAAQPDDEGSLNGFAWTSGLQFVLDCMTPADIDQSDPAQFSRPRRVTTREGLAMEALVQFRNGVTELSPEGEPSTDDVEYTNQQDSSDSGDEPEPGPPVKIPLRRSLYSLCAGVICPEMGPKTGILQTKALPPKYSMEAGSAPRGPDARPPSPLSVAAKNPSLAAPGKALRNPPPSAATNSAGEPQAAQNGPPFDSNTCNVHGQSTPPISDPDPSSSISKQNSPKSDETGSTLAPSDRHIQTSTPSKHSTSTTKRLRDGTRKENSDSSHSADGPQNALNNLPTPSKPALAEGPKPAAEGKISSGHMNPLREPSASGGGPFVGDIPPSNGDSSGGRPNGAGRKSHTSPATNKVDGRRLPHPPLSKTIHRQDATANEEACRDPFGYKPSHTDFLQKRRGTANTNHPKVDPSVRHTSDKFGAGPPPGLTEYPKPGVTSPTAPQSHKGTHSDSNATVTNSPVPPRGSRNINNSPQASWTNKRTQRDLYHNIPQDHHLFPPAAISAARSQQKAAENSARAAANSLSTSGYPHIVPRPPPSKIAPMNYPNYGPSNGGSSVNIPNFIPRSPYPANRSAAVPQPHEYAAPNSSAARDARPPQPSQPSHPPPWTDVGYTYPGPQPPSAQFQAPASNNPDRASAQPSDSRTHIINRSLPRQPVPSSTDFGNYINNGYAGPSNGSYKPQQSHQQYAPQYSGAPRQDSNHNKHPYESLPWASPVTSAPILSGDTSHTHSSSRVLRPHDNLYSHSTSSAPAESKIPSVNTSQPIRYYIGDGIYKTAPAPIDKPLMPHRPQDTVFEEDVYSKDLNLMARNGTWKGQQQHPPHMPAEDARRGGSGGN